MTRIPVDLAALRSGGKAALARSLTALETRPDDPALVRLLDEAWADPRGIVLGITGPPGVGKSTLTGELVSRMRAGGETVAVIAVDPSSRKSGGSLLGDRTRIRTDPDDADVFVRSMAARDRLGGVADLTFPACVLMRAIYDRTIVETVGVGQSETEISDCSDLVIFCVQPGSGDALQFMKAGIMEVPDIILVTKGDLGTAALTAMADVKGAASLHSGPERGPEVFIVSSQTGHGIDDVLRRITDIASDPEGRVALRVRRNGQSEAWIRAALRESFGEIGLAAIKSRITPANRPFETVTGLSQRARCVVDEIIKNI